MRFQIHKMKLRENTFVWIILLATLVLYIILNVHLFQRVISYNNKLASSLHNCSMGCIISSSQIIGHHPNRTLLFSRNVNNPKKVIKMIGPTYARKTVIYKQCIQMLPENAFLHQVVKCHIDYLLQKHKLPLSYDADTLSKLQMCLIRQTRPDIDYESALYLVEHAQRILNIEHTLTMQDYLHVGVRTTGYSDMEFVSIGGHLCHLYDVSAQVRKWRNILLATPPADVMLFVIPFSNDMSVIEKWISDFNWAMTNERKRCKNVYTVVTGRIDEGGRFLEKLILSSVTNVTAVIYINAFNATEVSLMIDTVLE